MGELLVLPNKLEIQESEKAEIDKVIEQTIALHKENGAMITKLTMDSVTALTASESRSKELAQQGFLKRTWNNLTGKNQKIRSQIDADMTRVQYTSQQMIQKLAEQNLLTFDLVTAVNNKLNTLVLELDEEINNIYKVLGAFFKQTRSDIVQLEARLDKVERNVELLHWNATIEYQMYDGNEYSMLPDEEKIVCLSNDFLHRTKGNWSTSDLMLLKSTLAELGLPVKQTISTNSFYNYLIEKPALINRLFEGISIDGIQTIEPYEAPLLKGVEKTLKLNAEEKYIVETVTEQLDLAGVAYNDRDIKLSMIHQYLKNNAYMNTDVEVNLFDFVVELLVNLNLINESIVVEEKKLQLEESDLGEHDVFLIDFGSSKIKVIKALSEINGMSLDEAKKIISQVPNTILSRLTKEKAENAKKLLKSAGANVIIKTYIENVHYITASKTGYIRLKDQNHFVKVDEYVKKNKRVAEISEFPLRENDTIAPGFISSIRAITGNEDTKINATVSGKIISILVQNGEKVDQDQPIMLILSDE